MGFVGKEAPTPERTAYEAEQQWQEAGCGN